MRHTDPDRHSVIFTGARLDFARLLLRFYALMVPTIGLSRFWLTTWKRRFYWGHTAIGGDALEYTGNAHQLLLGFLMTLALFLPLYGLFFYLSTQSASILIIGYGGVAVLLWFLYGYAIYRARDFRLSRTLWRGIRFDQRGNAWAYALRRFFWSLLTLATLGLAYPFMAVSLWRYRYRHSWYGDRQFGFSGSWKQLAWPYYLTWLALASLLLLGLGVAAGTGLLDDPLSGDLRGYVWLAGPALGALILVTVYRAAEMTRMFSAIRLGGATLSLDMPAIGLLGQYALFAIALALAYLLLALGGFLVLSLVAGEALAGGTLDFDLLMGSMQSSLATLLAIITGYLLLFGAFVFVSELVRGYGFWWLMARGATISGLASLDDVQARGEDLSLAGEGLADALNVGGY
ncbi:MAG: hypothetical protein ABS75_29755 [Pelagibacterium sp. SCN 63-23]|nr:MAG: hypothetical protein ABS75_29755 [Pelagibacterium sp. SCN 63-23]